MSLFLSLQELCSVISDTVKPFESAALVNSEGQVLGMKYESLPDIGTFAPLVQTVCKYFPLKEGDIVLTNDPYSGGTLLSAMNLVTAIQVADQTFYLAVRTRFKPHLAHATKLEDEGLRIPPTPLATGFQINEAILSAISSHPQAPEGLAPRLVEKVGQMRRQIDLLKKWHKANPQMLSKNNQKTLLQETRARIQKRLNEMPHGDHRMDLNFETGEVIRLHTEIKAEEIHFDFAGTSNSKRLFLTNLATFGTCLGAFLSFLREDFLINEGLFSFINVTTPQGCFLNARYPAPAFEGLAEGSTLLASAVVQSLSAIGSSQSLGMNGSVPTVLSFEFAPNRIYFDPMAGGTGATPESNGLDAYIFWNLSRLQTSIEEIERRYPVLILQSGIRQGSGGKGKSTGGNGVLRETELREACTLRWLIGHRNTQTKNLKGGASGQASEIRIHKASGEEIVIKDTIGHLKLEKGDRVIATSAGGAGYGKAGESKNPSA